jgi:cytochrome P450
MSRDFEGATYPSQEFLANPYELYEWLRETHPVYVVPERSEYLVSRFADVKDVLQRPNVFSNAFPRQPEKVGRPLDVLESDDPEHRIKRALCLTGIGRSDIEGHELKITKIVDALIDEFIDKGRFSLIGDFGSRLPVYVFASIYGLEADELWRIHSSAPYIGPARRYETSEKRNEDLNRSFQMYDFLGEAVRTRISGQHDDLIGRLIEHSTPPDLDELQSELDILFIGGLTTTPHLIVNTMNLLMEHRNVMAEVRDNVSLIPNMLEESLRLESPVQWQPRITTEDAEIAEVPVPRGSRVLTIFGSANRDPRMFEDPDRFDIHRSNVRQHLGFGYGIHRCIGAPLARLEVRIALERLFARMGEMSVAADNEYAPSPGLSSKSLAELNLEFEPA